MPICARAHFSRFDPKSLTLAASTPGWSPGSPGGRPGCALWACGEVLTVWLELRRLPPNSAPDSGVIFHAAAGVGPPRTDIRKSEEKLHLKDSHQTRTGRAQGAAPRRYALLSLQTRLLAVFYALGTG